MSKYSDWRSDLREVMDDDVDEKKVTGKGVNNNKLIKINPKLGEAVEQIGGQILEVAEVDTVDGEEEEDKSKKFEKEKQDKIAEKNKKKEMMLKKRIVRMKMMAVNQGAGDSLVAHHEPEGEMVESAVLDANKELAGPPKPKRSLGKKVRRAVLLNMIKRGWDKKRIKHVMHGEEVELTEAERKLSDRLHRKRKLYDRTVKKAMEYARREGEAAGHARYRMGQLDTEMDKVKDKMKKEEVELDERLGGKGYSRSAMKSSIHPPSRQSTGDWEDSDRGKGNKARRRAGEKVEKKSPTYRAYVLNKEEVVLEKKKQPSVHDDYYDPMEDPTFDPHEAEATRGQSGRGTRGKMNVRKKYPVKEEKGCKGKGRHPRDQEELDRAEAFIKKNPNFGKKVNEGVMKFIKDRVGGKKKPQKKAEMDKTTEKLHDLRREKFKTDKQREHEKYVNFLPVDEEVVTELNRYGKETGKATGSLNKRPGSPVATVNQPNSAVNIVRRNVIRPQTGRPEGQRKKVKGEKGRVQPGDRKFTPAQTISRMRAQVAAADAAMRDTRGT